jgi:hypothetical protein
VKTILRNNRETDKLRQVEEAAADADSTESLDEGNTAEKKL